MFSSESLNLWMLTQIAAAAALGGATRYLLAGVIDRRWGDRFPWGTLAVNLSGALLMGMLAGWLGVLSATNLVSLSPSWWIVGIGFIGSYTTVSSFSLQTLGLIQQQQWRSAALYVIGSILLCPLLFAAGWVLTQWAQA